MPSPIYFIPRFSRSQSYDLQTQAALSRIAAVAGYGYNLSVPNADFIDSRLKLFRANGGLPDWYLNPELGINKNIHNSTRPTGWTVINGATLGSPDADGWCLLTDGALANSGIQQTLGVLPLGYQYTLSFEAKAGTASSLVAFVQEPSPFVQIISTTVTGLSSTGQTITATGTNTLTTSLTTNIRVGTSAGINEGTIWIRNIQLEVGSVRTSYALRSDNTAVRSLNFGSKNASGDASFVNGTSTNMIVNDAAGQSNFMVASSSQGLQSSFADWYPNYSYVIAYKPTTLGGAVLIKSNASDRIVVNGDGSWRFNGTTGLVQSAVGNLTAGGWVILGITVSGTTVKLYRNGVLLTPATNTLSVRTSETATNWSISTSAFINGLIGESVLIPVTITDANMTNIFNAMRSKYGL